MKTCPVCSSRAFDDADICYGCLHQFEEPAVQGRKSDYAHADCGEKSHRDRQAAPMPRAGKHATQPKDGACLPKTDRLRKGCAEKGLPPMDVPLYRNDVPARGQARGYVSERFRGYVESGPIVGQEWTVGIEFPAGACGRVERNLGDACGESDSGSGVAKERTPCNRVPSILIHVHMPGRPLPCSDSSLVKDVKRVPAEGHLAAVPDPFRAAGAAEVRR